MTLGRMPNPIALPDGLPAVSTAAEKAWQACIGCLWLVVTPARADSTHPSVVKLLPLIS